MQKQRLDTELVRRKLVTTRSQAESYIKLGYVKVGEKVISKPGFFVAEDTAIMLNVADKYVSRAALKLASVAEALKLEFNGKVVLDVGSSTGGFTDYALQHGARKVIAVDVGTNQMHPSLRNDPRVALFEQTDIRDVHKLTEPTDIVVIDVSFISLREILPHVATLINKPTQVIAMVKPQFEVYAEQSRSTNIELHLSTGSRFRDARSDLLNKGVIKNDKIRRNTLKTFENWVQELFIIVNKVDSLVAGAQGNRERFYLLKKLK